MKEQNIGLANKRIHFIGIGGISMSGLAQIALKQGCSVSGSDIKVSPLTHKLEQLGATVYIGHSAEHVKGAEMVVYTAAIQNNNPELERAKQLNIPIIDRATFLGQIMQHYNFGIAVAGTHGKTTTTSMISIIMQYGNLDPTVLVGGELDAIGGNARIGHSQYFVTEACEYVESFLKFYPYIAVILNIERDHLDYFHNIDDIYKAFLSFARLSPDNGYVVGCIDDPLVEKLLNEVNKKTISYGISKSANWKARNIDFDQNGCPSFTVYHNDKVVDRFHLNIPGQHNVYNALAAIATSQLLPDPIDIKLVKEALLLYKGAHRRFEIKGHLKGNVTIIDDYAHHPTEIKATLKAAKNYPHNRIWCIFQPHTYSRTRFLMDEFAVAFGDADYLIITDIYAARETDNGLVSAKNLVKKIKEHGQDAIYLSDFASIKHYIKEHCQEGDLVITMGAGDVYRIGDELLAEEGEAQAFYANVQETSS